MVLSGVTKLGCVVLCVVTETVLGVTEGSRLWARSLP